jgi:hypothetical protein
MKKTALICCLVVVTIAMLVGAAPNSSADMPQYTTDHQLLRPENYRDWVFLSSGLGMNYSPAPGTHDLFTNVFVPRWAYDEFQKSGKWPEKTMFVVEEREAQSRGSINKHGNFQTDFAGMGVEVKDKSAFPEQWAYFNFGEDTKSATANPKAGCFNCHDAHAAVEHSFVQFYPTLKATAKKYGTYNAEREKVD